MNDNLKKAIKDENLNEIKKLFRKNDFNIEIINEAFILAVEQEYLNIVKFLVENGGDITCFFNKALMIASYKGNYNIVDFLIKSGVDVNAIYDGNFNNNPYGYSKTALQNASRDNNLDIIFLLITNGANININDNGRILKCASLKNNFKLIELMLEKGYVIDSENDSESLKHSTKKDDTRIMSLLIKHGNYDQSTYDEALRYSSMCGHLNSVKLLIENGASNENNALIYAAARNELDVVEFFIEERGLDVNLIDREGKSLLEAAIHWGRLKDENMNTAKYLFKKGAKIDNITINICLESFLNCKDIKLDGVEFLLDIGGKITNKCLISILKNGNLKLIELLFKYGIDIHIENYIALRFASKNGNLNLVIFLIEHRADIHAENNESLNNAIENNHFEIAKILIERAKYNDINSLKLAFKFRRFDIIKLLIQNGADIKLGESFDSERQQNYLDIINFFMSNS